MPNEQESKEATAAASKQPTVHRTVLRQVAPGGREHEGVGSRKTTATT